MTDPADPPATEKDLGALDASAVDVTIGTPPTRLLGAAHVPGADGITIAPDAMPADSLRLPDGALHVAGGRYEEGDVAWVSDPWTGVSLPGPWSLEYRFRVHSSISRVSTVGHCARTCARI